MPTTTQARASRFEKSPLHKVNAGRKLAAALQPILVSDEARLRAAGFQQPITSLEDYEKQHANAGVLMDNDREPFLVMSLPLECGMHPLTEVFDVGSKRVTVGTGRRFGKVELVNVSTKSGDALLLPDTLLIWR